MGISNLSDYPAAKIVLACLKSRLRVQYDRAAVLAGGGNRAAPRAAHQHCTAPWLRAGRPAVNRYLCPLRRSLPGASRPAAQGRAAVTDFVEQIRPPDVLAKW